MNIIQISNHINTETEKISLSFIAWNIIGWGEKQGLVKKKVRKIKNQIQQYNIVILIEKHLVDNK